MTTVLAPRPTSIVVIASRSGAFPSSSAAAAVLRAEVGELTGRPLAKGMVTDEESGIYGRAEETCDHGEEFGSHFAVIASTSEAAPDLPELPKDGGLRVTGRSASCGRAIVK